ncbi:Uncharacterised protein [Salmonella bongori]|nr:Uncharacterised protein [Salmonella bongori]
MKCGNDPFKVTPGHVGKERQRANSFAVPFSIGQRERRKTFAIIFLRMRGAEMQTRANAFCFQRCHQSIPIDAAACFINPDNKQMPGMDMFPWRKAQGLKGQGRHRLVVLGCNGGATSVKGIPFL